MSATMLDSTLKSSKRVLEPFDRVSEVLFGLIMVLTFTGSLSVAAAGKTEIRTMLTGALGCNLAWGVIDGILYLMGCLAEKSKAILTLRAVRQSADPQRARGLIADALPTGLLALLQDAELETLRQRIVALPEPPAHARLDHKDWRGGFAVFLLVFLSTFPVVLPFLFMQDARLALRISNLIAMAMLFATGWVFGRITGRRKWVVGLTMVVLGGALVALTIALGG